MPSKSQQNQIEVEGRKFASMLYDLPIKKLTRPTETDLQQWAKEFPLVDEANFNYILQQTQEARTYQQERVGWQSIPHDFTVIVFVLITWFFGLKTGIIAGIAVLVFLESLFQVVFIRQLYKPLSFLVWLTYPAYALFAGHLYQQGYSWYWIVLGVLAAWVGTFLLGVVARIPMRLILEAQKKAEERKARESQG